MEYLKVKLGEICKINQLSYSQKDNWDVINYLDTGNITQNVIDEIQELRVGVDKIPSRAKRKVQIDDIIYSTVRPNQLHYGIIKSMPQNLLVSTGFVVITVDKAKADADYIYYYLTQSHIIESLHAIGEQSTSAYPSIKPSDLECLELDLPPLEVQRKIAFILRTIEEKMAINSKLNANLEEICIEIYKDCISKNICSEVLLKDVVSLLGDGLHGTPIYDEYGEYYFVNGNNLVNGHITIKNDTKRINEVEYKKYRKELNGRTILVSINGTIGNVALYNGEKCILGKSACYFNVKEEIGKYFMKYVILSNEFQNSIKYNATGTTIKNVSLKQMREYVLKLPDKNILKSVELILEDINKKIEINYQMNIRLCNIRDTLLPKLMSGEIALSKINVDI